MRTLAASLAKRRRRAGQTIVEFALAGTLFFLVLFGLMDMAYGTFCYNMVSSAARTAVRYAIVHGPTSASPATTAQIQQVAVNAAPGVNLSLSDVTVTWPADPNLPSKTDARVKITFNYRLLIAYFTPTNMTISSTSQMLVSQ